MTDEIPLNEAGVPCLKCAGRAPRRGTHALDCPKRKGGRPPVTYAPDLPVSTDLSESADSVREAVFTVYNNLGGIRGMTAWARKNQAAFYKLWMTMGPRARPGAQPRQKPGDVKVAIPGFNDAS